MFARHGEQCGNRDHVSPAMASRLLARRVASVQFFCFVFCVLFTRFCFELTFGINMKVLKDFISFPMALSWLENTLWILIYDGNTPSKSWRILKKLMLVNAYMLVDWVVVGKLIYVNWIVNVLVIAYMSSDGELLMNSYMNICWWWCGDIVCVNICIESSHMFMHTWLMVMVTDVYIQM